ncbi:MAG: pilus assembly protein N-terminal domain-containing protein [Oceanicaulis sp.]
MVLRALAAAALSLALTAPALANAHTVRVPANHAGLVRLPEGAATIVVGNPAIADAALYDDRTVIVSGRTFGQTNMIAMNEAGHVIYAADLSITESDRNHVRVYRNNVQFSFVCDPECQSVPTVGDQREWHQMLSNQRSVETGAADSAAENGAGG